MQALARIGQAVDALSIPAYRQAKSLLGAAQRCT
jgi:hypothetical protein